MISPLSNYMPLYIRETLPTSDRRVEGAPQLGSGAGGEAAAVFGPRGDRAPRPVTSPEAGSRSDDRERGLPGRPATERNEGTREENGTQQALSEEEQAELKRLKERDAEVRRHEQAHAAAGGQYAGSPNYEYERGPDGRRYAVGGHVNIDVSEVRGDPEATVQKMRQVQRAALAPAEPSGQDRKVAAEAAAKEAKATRELQETRGDDAAGEVAANTLAGLGATTRLGAPSSGAQAYAAMNAPAQASSVFLVA